MCTALNEQAGVFLYKFFNNSSLIVQFGYFMICRRFLGLKAFPVPPSFKKTWNRQSSESNRCNLLKLLWLLYNRWILKGNTPEILCITKELKEHNAFLLQVLLHAQISGNVGSIRISIGDCLPQNEIDKCYME